MSWCRCGDRSGSGERARGRCDFAAVLECGGSFATVCVALCGVCGRGGAPVVGCSARENRCVRYCEREEIIQARVARGAGFGPGWWGGVGTTLQAIATV